MPLLRYTLRLDQLADSPSFYKWTLYPPGTPNPPPIGATPTDLTGAHARMMIRSHPNDAAPLVSLTDTLGSQGQLVLGGTAGTVALNLSKTASALLVATVRGAVGAKYLWDLFVDLANGTSINIVGGDIDDSIAITH